MYLKYITYLISYSIYLSKYGKNNTYDVLYFQILNSVVKYERNQTKSKKNGG